MSTEAFTDMPLSQPTTNAIKDLGFKCMTQIPTYRHQLLELPFCSSNLIKACNSSSIHSKSGLIGYMSGFMVILCEVEEQHRIYKLKMDGWCVFLFFNKRFGYCLKIIICLFNEIYLISLIFYNQK